MAELKPKRQGNYHHNGNTKHGLYRKNSALFNIWQTMIGRCENPNRPKYKDYGGRGIKVCNEWKTAGNSPAVWTGGVAASAESSPQASAPRIHTALTAVQRWTVGIRMDRELAIDILKALACCSVSTLHCYEFPLWDTKKHKCRSWTDEEVCEAVRTLDGERREGE